MRDYKQHLWLNSARIDSFGTMLLVARDPTGFAAISAWPEFYRATETLCHDFVGAAAWDKHKSDLLEVVLKEVAAKFGLVSRSLNSAEMPAVARVSWGYLLQLPGTELGPLCDYLHLPPLEKCELPIVHGLGGHLVTVLGIRPERVKLAVCFNGLEREAIHSFQHWLFKQAEPAATT